jgi:transposase
MNGDLFEGWLERVFVTALKNPSKSVLIINNASCRRKNAIYDIADEYEFRVIFLPPYSHDLSPIYA